MGVIILGRGIIHDTMIRHRYRRIVLFFARLLMSFIAWDVIMPRLGLGAWAKRTRRERIRRSAVAFRNLAVQMGGVLIKVGQFLSTRVDVLPKEFTDELAGLQDEVPPEDFRDIVRVAEAEYSVPLQEKFAEFEETPLAAASLGQVHRAKILEKSTTNPEEETVLKVVVKIQRPNIETLIATDLAALRTVGGWLHRYRPIRRRANIPALLEEFTRILSEEVDYLAEGRNAEIFAENFRDDIGVRVPNVIWSHTTKRALTLEDVFAIKITDFEGITAAGIDRAEVASRLIDTYLQQIFEDGFFHADPHPGNLFVSPLRNGGDGNEPDNNGLHWQLTFVDFGMVGRVPPNTKHGLRELLIGVGTRDATRVVKAYQMLGILLPEANLELLEKAEEKLFERFWGKTMSELQHLDPQELRQYASEFRELIFTMPFQVPQDFIFLVRTVGILSGLCTSLDPKFNIWTHLVPYAQKLIAEEARFNIGFWVERVENWLRLLTSLPWRMESTLAKLERGEVVVRVPEVSQNIRDLEEAVRQIVRAFIFIGVFLGGVQLYLAGKSPMAEILLVAGSLGLLWMIIRGGKRRVV